MLTNLHFLWKAEILWEKNNYNAKYTAWGSWKSPSMPYLKYTWEFIEIFDKETHRKAGGGRTSTSPSKSSRQSKKRTLTLNVRALARKAGIRIKGIYEFDLGKKPALQTPCSRDLGRRAGSYSRTQCLKSLQ
jgi:DNA modification methylase